MLGTGRQKREEGGRGGRGEIMAREGIKVEGERSGHALEGDSNSRVCMFESLSKVAVIRSKGRTYSWRLPLPQHIPLIKPHISSPTTTTTPSNHHPTLLAISIRYMHLRQRNLPQLFFHARNLAHLAVNCQLCNKLFTPGYWPVILAFSGLTPKIPSLSLDLSASR